MAPQSENLRGIVSMVAFGIGCAIGFYLILRQRGERVCNRAFFEPSVVPHNCGEVVATIGIHRISAVAVGFVGVLMIIRPGMDDFNFYSLIAVFGVLGMSTRDIGSRLTLKSISTMLLSLYSSPLVTLTRVGMLCGTEWLLWPNSQA
jgi:hypothetical protein